MSENKQVACQKRVSECGKIEVLIENDTSLSVFHDFLLAQKGHCIDLMVKLQKDEEGRMAKEKELAEEEANLEMKQPESEG